MDFPSPRFAPDRIKNVEGCIEVAVKQLTIQGSAVTDVDKFYTKETDTLDKMRELDNAHLIKAVAAYRKGPDRCFVFPWAQGGSLRDLWRSYQAILDEDLVSWAINQMVGLCDGLRLLHNKQIRHGDLKPDNILCFMSGNNSPHQRTLVLADVGLAKVEECESNLHFILTEVANTTQPRTSLLHDQWLNVTDNGTARTLISRLDWPTSRVCDPCAALDFQLPTLDLRRSIEELSNGSDKCSLCHFLFRCLTKAKAKPDKSLRLLRDDASRTLRVPGSTSPVISIYFDPASKDNTPSYAQLGLPILSECTSEQQFKVLNEWINLCDTTHNCNSAQEHDRHMEGMPTRVIDVGTVDSPSLQLVETGDSIRGKYLALSHCWGKLEEDQKFVTSASNFDNRKEEIPFDKMPRTFQDAVRTNRALGIAYLWIDSLCIIQGDEADWEAESAKMEEVFSSAY
ncbi:hypothetical protein CEP52_017481 [Fusarium oligoseptatum]|uniref:Protein kinase domain-containing protein n=1 Tax=Fusarium oligoseptatum TaxID=2604345 RepID=A0A428RQV4_9HYPO|nr:hypothetical protein CEP52_017481 [Fusarium oligoseptatum]